MLTYELIGWTNFSLKSSGTRVSPQRADHPVLSALSTAACPGLSIRAQLVKTTTIVPDQRCYSSVMVAIHRLPLLPTNHLTSLYIGPPVNMYVSNNTFIKYRVGDSEYVGLVTNVNASTARMVVRKFLSWDQLIQEVPQACIEGVSFWPCSNKPPFFMRHRFSCRYRISSSG